MRDDPTLDAGGETPSGGRMVLLGLRFLLELSLLVAVLVGTARLVGGGAGWVLGVLAAVAVAVVWGLFLSPRRRVASPRAVRVTLELGLFAGAAGLLAASGLLAPALVLLVAELVVLALLGGPDPPRG